jgi:hypothetical protein
MGLDRPSEANVVMFIFQYAKRSRRKDAQRGQRVRFDDPREKGSLGLGSSRLMLSPIT